MNVEYTLKTSKCQNLWTPTIDFIHVVNFNEQKAYKRGYLFIAIMKTTYLYIVFFCYWIFF